MTSSRDRHDELLALTNCTDPDPYHSDDDCAACLNARALRMMLIDFPDFDDTYDAPDADHLRDHIIALHEHALLPYDETARHMLSMLALDHSLCPMHFIDYAICFDDDDADCATIRRYFPIHDT